MWAASSGAYWLAHDKDPQSSSVMTSAGPRVSGSAACIKSIHSILRCKLRYPRQLSRCPHGWCEDGHVDGWSPACLHLFDSPSSEPGARRTVQRKANGSKTLHPRKQPALLPLPGLPSRAYQVPVVTALATFDCYCSAFQPRDWPDMSKRKKTHRGSTR